MHQGENLRQPHDPPGSGEGIMRVGHVDGVHPWQFMVKEAKPEILCPQPPSLHLKPQCATILYRKILLIIIYR